jgi:NADPH:quinone reductase-like Zn-dependent oxidoreductase
MRAVVMHETGGPEVLLLEEVPTPEPADGQVLVRVHAASVNPIDWKIRSGSSSGTVELPKILGNDISGTVEVSHADGLSVGEDVFGFAPSGGYAEYALSGPVVLARKPAAVTHEQAAALPVAALTAWQALFDRGGLQSGQRAMIAGAAGGVGHLAVQFAKRAGAHVIGSGSTRNRDFVLGLGADEYIDYTRQDVREAVSDVDVVLDTVGGETTQALVPLMHEGGILITIASAPPEAPARALGARAELMSMSPNPDQLARIAALLAGGEIRVELSQVLPLAEVQRAHELSESGHTRGKIVLIVD